MTPKKIIVLLLVLFSFNAAFANAIPKSVSLIPEWTLGYVNKDIPVLFLSTHGYNKPDTENTKLVIVCVDNKTPVIFLEISRKGLMQKSYEGDYYSFLDTGGSIHPYPYTLSMLNLDMAHIYMTSNSITYFLLQLFQEQSFLKLLVVVGTVKTIYSFYWVNSPDYSYLPCLKNN